MKKNTIYISDIHSHILFGVDDGAKNLEQSNAMLKIAYKEGVRNIILTPHYSKTSGQGINVWKERYGQLLQMAELSFPGLSLYMGGEIFYRTDTVSELISHKIPTMVGGRYVLLEFDVSISYGKITQAIMEVIQNEYIPIIAHVERYECLLGYVDRICELKELGAYIQVNVSGVMGEHGKPEKKFIKKLLKREMINFVATDAHRDDKRAPYIKDCCRYIEKKYGYDYAKRIFSDNPACIISNRFIEE